MLFREGIQCFYYMGEMSSIKTVQKDRISLTLSGGARSTMTRIFSMVWSDSL